MRVWNKRRKAENVVSPNESASLKREIVDTHTENESNQNLVYDCLFDQI